MPYSIANEEKKMFHEEGRVILQDVIPADQAGDLVEAIHAALPTFSRRGEEEAYQSGRDLWRESSAIARIVCNKSLARLASDLLNEPLIRLAYDQYLPIPDRGVRLFPGQEKAPYERLIATETTLQEMSCISGLVGGWIFPLEGRDDHTFFPARLGDAVFFRGDHPLPLSEIEGECLLIAYARRRALYDFKECDLHTHALKRRGYSFGEYLKDHLHPILRR